MAKSQEGYGGFNVHAYTYRGVRNFCRILAMTAARKWTEEEITEIKRLYCEEKLSLTKVGKKFKVDKAAIKRLLVQQQIKIRSSSETRRQVTDEQIRDFYRRYELGESLEAIGKSHGFSSGDTVAKYLQEKGLYKRKKKVDDFPRSKYPDIVRSYKDGVNTVELAKKYQCSRITIRNVLIRSGVELRSMSEAFGFPRESDQKKICEYYSEGNNLEATAQKFDCSRKKVKKVLRLHDKRIREPHESRTGIHPDEWDAICRRYVEDEETSTSIAKDYNVVSETITRIITRRGFKIRNTRERHMSIPRSQWAAVCESYRKGKNTYLIASELNIPTPYAVSRVLKLNGVEIRGDSEGAGEGIIHLLMDECRFQFQRETDFYIYSINGHPHFKPGIAFSHEERAVNSQGLYHIPELVQTYETRHEAWLVEYMVLEETSQYMDIPQELNGWPGSYELRLIDLEDLKSVFDFYDDQLEELGIYEYALKYVDMTEDERNICEQRLRMSEVSAMGTLDK